MKKKLTTTSLFGIHSNKKEKPQLLLPSHHNRQYASRIDDTKKNLRVQKVKKSIIYAAIACGTSLSLAACQTPQQIAATQHEIVVKNNFAELIAWEKSQVNLVKEGKITRSEFWIKYYNKTDQLDQTAYRLPHLEFVNKMINESRLLESGKVNKIQYDDYRRSEYLKMQQKEHDLFEHFMEKKQAQDEAEANRRAALESAYIAAHPIYQSAPSPPVYVPPTEHTNCMPNGMGGISCTSN